MQIRKFGKLDWQCSALGFGTMRLPQTDDNPCHVDEQATVKMIRYAIDNGINYIDSAYFYHQGQSERVVGKALKNGYREKVKLATKLPVDLVQSPNDFDRFFNEQLTRLDMPKVDFYLLHGIGADSWHKVRDMGVINWAEKQIAKAYFDYLAFSFHDEYPALKEIIDAYDNWTFAQVLYNYLDINVQAGTRGVKYAASKNLGVVVMEPLRGGFLSRRPPEPVVKVFETASVQKSYAEWALQWLWDQPEISVVLSGMSTLQQVHENLASAERSGPRKLTGDETALFSKVRNAYRDLFPVPCTACRYCMPCPSDVNIPVIFQYCNDAVAYNMLHASQSRYAGLKMNGHRADRCTECNKCVEVCPQKIAVPAQLKKAHEFLSPKK
jgi:uncharacterized protein